MSLLLLLKRLFTATPTTRIYTVAAESRTYTISAESRVLTIASESRTETITNGDNHMTMTVYQKDPSAVLDWAFSWASWLATSETISSQTVTVSPSGLTAGTPTQADGVVTVWLSSGTAGLRYTVTCNIVTNAGRTDERSIYVDCLDR